MFCSLKLLLSVVDCKKMLSGINLDYFVLDLYKRVKCMLKKFMENCFSKLFVCKTVCLATLFFNLERVQVSDKNWSGSIL